MAFTFFFRDQQVLERVVEQLLPALAGRSHPRIWDAGSAMGQEPYTLAIILAGRMSHFGFNNVRIDATDVEGTGQFGQMIEAGIYPRDELSRLPDGILEKYFEPNGAHDYFRVVDSIRRRVAYQRHDLLSLAEIGHGYSLVLCKNVLLRFQAEERIAVLRMFHRALAPGGLLATEMTQEMPPELSPLFQRAIHGAPVYRKVEAARLRILTLENSGQFYTSQVYLVLGSASRLEDVNTLVDVGQDPAILESVARAPTGVGKWPVEQVVLTHNHSDHTALLPRVRAAFHPKVLAFSPNTEGVDRQVRDGETIRMGDRYFEVIHTPGHSSDSICLYNQADGVLFAGDSPLLIASAAGTYEAGFLAALEKLCARDVRTIYFGHGPPLRERCNERLSESHRLAEGSSGAGVSAC